MDVNNINTNAANANTNVYTPPEVKEPEPVAAAAEPKDEAASVYEPAAGNKTYKPDVNKIREMWNENNAKVESFRRLIEGLLNKQAQKAGVAEDWWQGKKPPFQAEMVDIDEETRAAAQKEIEEGGYYSVEETAKRILDFAVAISGGDSSKIGVLKDAVMKGFSAAEKTWGGELPDISKKTLEAVQQGFEEWEKSGDANDITLLNKKAGTGAL